MNSFSSVMGHAKPKEILSRMIINKSLPHAIAFVGPSHVGKTTLMRALCQQVLQTENLLSHPDYLELACAHDEKTGKRKSAISVRQVRELVRRLSLTSFSGGPKVVCILEAHKLSVGAVNALLKTVEEPKGNVLFLLRTPSSQSIAATLLSRCQMLRFAFVSREEMKGFFVREGASDEDAHQAAYQSYGRPGIGKRILKDSRYRSEMETGLACALSFLNGSLSSRLAQTTQLIAKSESDPSARLSYLVQYMQMLSRDMLLAKIGAQEWSSHQPSHPENLSAQNVLAYLHRLARVRQAISHNINPHLALEHIALSA